MVASKANPKDDITLSEESIRNLAKRLVAAERKLKTQGNKLKEHETKLASLRGLQSAVSDHTDLFKFIDPKNARKVVDNMRSRAAEMDRTIQMLILRATVATEIAHYVRHTDGPDHVGPIANILFHAHDNDDAWWYERRDLSVRAWFNELLGWWSEGGRIVTAEEETVPDPVDEEESE
jgi:DNA-directed RNA polymerase subunit F